MSGPALFLIGLLDAGGSPRAFACAFQLVLRADVAGKAATFAATLRDLAFGAEEVIGVAMSIV